MKDSTASVFSGSRFDDFLQVEGLYEEVESAALLQVLAWQAEDAPRTNTLNSKVPYLEK
jgi:hypothetical protein